MKYTVFLAVRIILMTLCLEAMQMQFLSDFFDMDETFRNK